MNDLVVKKKKKKKLAAAPEASKKKKTIVVSGGDALPEKAKVKKSAPSIAVNQDDYIIVNVNGKNKLGFAHSPKRNTCYIEETMNNDEPVTFEYDSDTLIANLGPKPKYGKVHGVNIEPKSGETVTPIGKVVFLRELDDDEKKALRVAIKKTHATLEHNGVEKLAPVAVVNVRNARGRWGASYKITRKDGEVHDTIELHSKIMNDIPYLHYLLTREFGRAAWHRALDESLRCDWLASYNSNVIVERAKKSQMENILQQLLESQLGTREFMRDIEEDDLRMFKEALAYRKKIHKICPEDVNPILNHNSKVLGGIWPTSAST